MISFVGSSALNLPDTPVAIPPNAAALSFSDYCQLSLDGTRARFFRPTNDGQGLEWVNPGARVRFNTDAVHSIVRLRYTNLSRPDLFQGVGAVLVDGALYQQFNGSAAVVDVAVALTFGSVVMRTVEVVMPYGASVDFLGLSLPTGALVAPAPVRSAVRYVAGGDSITHGYYTSAEVHSWSWKLGKAKGWQCINHGYGGRQCVAADGTTLAGLAPSVVSYLIGYNDFGAQLPLATFKANYTAFVNAFRAGAPAVKLYCITPIYTTSVSPLTIEQYRQQIRDALTALANPLNVLVEGLTLMTNTADRLLDGIHPNDTGAAEIATNLAAVISA
jgi:lysophospholipase L1-like esterase